MPIVGEFDILYTYTYNLFIRRCIYQYLITWAQPTLHLDVNPFAAFDVEKDREKEGEREREKEREREREGERGRERKRKRERGRERGREREGGYGRELTSEKGKGTIYIYMCCIRIIRV